MVQRVRARLGATRRLGLVALALCAIAQVAVGLEGPATQPTPAPSNGITKPAAAQLGATSKPSTDLPTAPPTPAVQALVADLSSDDFTTRQNSEKKLEQMGAAIEPQLLWVLNGKLDDEARARVQSALRHIRESRDFGPSVITMHYQDAPLMDVLEDFSKQAGADLGLHRPRVAQIAAGKKITLNVDHASFWDALTAVEDASGLHPRQGDRNGAMILDEFGGGIVVQGVPSVVAGPCRIQITQSITQYNYANKSSNVRLIMQAIVEPKLHVTGSLRRPWLKECVDNKGHSLAPLQGQQMLGGDRNWFVQLSANLVPVPDMGNTIARLRGELNFEIETSSEMISVDDLSKLNNLTKTINGQLITLDKFTPVGNNQFQLHIVTARPGNQGNMNQQMLQTLQILDANDQPLLQVGSSTSVRPNEMNTTLNFMVSQPNAAGPMKLRWQVTTASRPVTVPFELDNFTLGLPGR